jgi:ATP synthase protein I
VNSSESPPATNLAESSDSSSELPPTLDASMQEYYKLQQELLRLTFLLMGIAFISVWVFYSFNIAINYVIGASTGVIYLRMLARNVEQLGREKKRVVSSSRLAILIGVIVIASRWDQLQILPIFLGFLTYKVAIIFFVLRTVALPNSN